MARRGVERKGSFHIWEPFCGGAAVTMKLMGISKLDELARRASDTLDGALPALVAELEAGAWQSMAEIADFFPLAVVNGIKVQIPLNGGYWVDFLADCAAQMVLIEYAGAGSGERAGTTGSKAA